MGYQIPSAPAQEHATSTSLESGHMSEAPPPSYSQVAGNDEDRFYSSEPPPTYTELFGELGQVESPKGFFYFVVKVFRILLSTVLATVVLSILNLIPISMIIVASNHVDDCPVEKYIPWWMIIFGTIVLTRSVLQLVVRKVYGKNPDLRAGPDSRLWSLVFAGKLLNLALLVFYVMGVLWVLPALTRISFTAKEGTDLYCDRVTFIFATVVLAFITSMLLLLCCFMVCCCGCLCFMNSRNRTRQ
uniref:Transmembrane protein n=1 Tax=Rhabditophanes sp. KR3021 TaxID=114890 RepID=A0AC35TPW6_9BILA